MKFFLVVVLILGGIFLYPESIRYIKTGLLILQTKPYEQNGSETILLVLGDSTGYGTGVRDTKDSVAGRIGQDFPELTISNNSKNGRTIGELVEVVESMDGQYEVVLLQIGGNDILRNRDVVVVERELVQIFARLKEHTDSIVMMSTGDVGGTAAFSGEKAAALTARTLAFRDMFRRVAAEHGVYYVDLYEPPETDVFQQNPEVYLASDGLHPSAAGYGEWYKKLKPVLAPLLKK